MKSTNKIIKCLKKMYRATATTATAAAANKKPYCKVCHDSGKSEKEYTSHWVKDLSGKVICPTLLSLECRCCYQLGHTVKFCPVNLKRNKQVERAAKEATKIERAAKKEASTKLAKEVKKPVNIYDLLDETPDKKSLVSVDEPDFEILDEVFEDVVADIGPKATTWASIAAMTKETGIIQQKEAAKNVIEENRSSSLLHITKNSLVEEKKNAAKEVNIAPTNCPTIFKYSWADWPSDTEDEDDYY